MICVIRVYALRPNNLIIAHPTTTFLLIRDNPPDPLNPCARLIRTYPTKIHHHPLRKCYYPLSQQQTMMNRSEINVSVVQATPNMGDIPANLRTIESYAMEEKTDLLVFPEMFLTGYLLEDELPRLAITMDGPEVKRLEKIASQSGSHIIVGGPVQGDRFDYYNSSLLIGPDGYIGRYDKWHLVNFLPFDEKRYFFKGTKLPVFETELGTIGLIICYDIFFPELCTALTMQGADIIVSISASPTFSRKFFEIVAPARAVENTVFFIFNNSFQFT